MDSRKNGVIIPIFKKALKTFKKKVVKPAAKSFTRGATSTFNKTIGYGAQRTPSLGKVTKAAKRLEPTGAFRKLTKAIGTSPKRRRGGSR